mgnify:CR=1 FL=1
MYDVDCVINFDFEEVNSAVLRNAQLHAMKKNKTDKVMVIVPHTFRNLFSNADCLAVITSELCCEYGIDDYHKVLNDDGDDYGKPKQRFLNKLKCKNNKLLQSIIRILPQSFNFFKIYLYTRFFINHRMMKYYVKRGLEDYCVGKLHDEYGIERNKYYRVGNFFDLAQFSVGKFDLSEYLNRNFQYVYEMIKDGCLYKSNINPDNILSLFALSCKQDKKIHSFFEKFITSQNRKIIIRTRNFAQKATEHNSNHEIFLNLSRELIKRDVLVLNLGCPLLSLGITNENYCEIDHRLEFSLELALCQGADACIMTAEAGLFVAFAASAISSIVQVDNEWSVAHSVPAISLFEARKHFGLADLDVRELLNAKKYAAAADYILLNFTNKGDSYSTNCRSDSVPFVIELT